MKSINLMNMGISANAVLTGFFSSMIFRLLRKDYEDQLAMLLVFAATVLWIPLGPMITLLFGWLDSANDDPQWLTVLSKMLEGVNMLLIFLWGQYIIVLLETDIVVHNVSPTLAIVFLVVVQLALISVSTAHAIRKPSRDEEVRTNAMMDASMDIGANISNFT
jgi:ABC-type transport system involved in multi-copper enzyme maturation permease subunit